MAFELAGLGPVHQESVPELNWTLLETHEELPLYIRARLEKDKNGIRMAMSEVCVKGGPAVELGFYVPKHDLTATQRKEYIKAIAADVIKGIEALFVGCEDDGCPNCKGQKVKIE